MTQFAAGLDIANALTVYSDTAAGKLRSALMNGELAIKGDAQKCVTAIIAANDVPLRLPLGSTAYNNIETALYMRLNALREMKQWHTVLIA